MSHVVKNFKFPTKGSQNIRLRHKKKNLLPQEGGGMLARRQYLFHFIKNLEKCKSLEMSQRIRPDLDKAAVSMKTIQLSRTQMWKVMLHLSSEL